MSEYTKPQTDVILQNNFEQNNLIMPALYVNKVALTVTGNVTSATLGSQITNIDESNKSYSNITVADGNTDIKVGGGQNTIIAGNGDNDITAIGSGKSDITLGNGSNIIKAANGYVTQDIYDFEFNFELDIDNNPDKVGYSNNTITVGDGINEIYCGNGSNIITTGNGGMAFGPSNGGQGYSTAHNIISVGNGNNTITTGTGYNEILIGGGMNNLHLNGHDFVTLRGYNTTEDGDLSIKTNLQNQYITISGGNSWINLNGATGYVTDLSTNSWIKVGKNSIVTGSNQSNITFIGDGSHEFYTGIDEVYHDTNSNDLAVNINNSRIKAYTNLTVQGGTGNFIQNSYQLTLVDATGDTYIESSGASTISGTNGLNLTLDAYDLGDIGGSTAEVLFRAGDGNETLNAASDSFVTGMTATGINAVANTVAGAKSNFIAIGNSGDDTLSAGTGNSTFTGGAGANLFLFTKTDASGGNTVITDFAASEDNQIALFDYGLTRTSLKKLLQISQNDAQGDAVLNLQNHTITLQGVSITDIDASQFVVLNTYK